MTIWRARIWRWKPLVVRPTHHEAQYRLMVHIGYWMIFLEKKP